MTTSSLSLLEYVIFILIFGVFFALFACAIRKSSSNFNDYVWGGEKVALLPVALSLIATHINGITFMYAGEVYQYGVNVCYEAIGIMACGVITWMQIGKLHKLKIISLNDYIEMRFNRTVKLIVIPLIYCGQIINAMVTAYTLSVFLGQVYGVPEFTWFLIIVISSFVLTALGGFRAVVWTDSFFTLAMVVSSCALAKIGVDKAGGFDHIWSSALEGDRLTTNWDLDPTIRVTPWSMTFGIFGTWFAFGTMFNPTIYQRYTALTEKQAKKAVMLHVTGIILFKAFAYLCGFIIYSMYHGCDPVLSGEILNYDQVLGYFVQQIGQSVSFFGTIFVVCNLSASVSTITTIMGTFSVTFYKDIFQPKFNPNNEDIRGRRLVQLSGLIMTVVMITLMAVLSSSGTILDLTTISLFPLCIYGCVLFMGIFMPRIGPIDALWGCSVSFVVFVWIIAGSRIAFKRGLIVNEMKPMKIDQCPRNVTHSLLDKQANVESLFWLYRISPFYQNLIGSSVCIGIASISSFIFQRNDSCSNEIKKKSEYDLVEIPSKKQGNRENVIGNLE